MIFFLQKHATNSVPNAYIFLMYGDFFSICSAECTYFVVQGAECRVQICHPDGINLNLLTP